MRWCGAEACPRSIVFPRGSRRRKSCSPRGRHQVPPPQAPQPVPPSLHAPYVRHQNNLRFPWLSSPRRFYVSTQRRDKTRMPTVGCHVYGESNFRDFFRASSKTSAVCEELHHKDDGSCMSNKHTLALILNGRWRRRFEEDKLPAILIVLSGFKSAGLGNTTVTFHCYCISLLRSFRSDRFCGTPVSSYQSRYCVGPLAMFPRLGITT